MLHDDKEKNKKYRLPDGKKARQVSLQRKLYNVNITQIKKGVRLWTASTPYR